MKYETLSEACRAWVETFNAIPQSVIEKLDGYEGGLRELTPPRLNDRVYIDYDDDWMSYYGEVVETHYDGEKDLYRIKIEGKDEDVILSRDQFTVIQHYILPIWGTMWTFSDTIDDDWLSGQFGTDGLQKMADCGFRIYETNDFDYIFGIDGAGYDFYSAHWEPLYKARGLKWHKFDDTEEQE